jgi:hypothetical protein
MLFEDRSERPINRKTSKKKKVVICGILIEVFVA